MKNREKKKKHYAALCVSSHAKKITAHGFISHLKTHNPSTPVPLSVHPNSVSAASYHSGPARNTVHSHKMPSGRRGRGSLRTEVQSYVPGEITAEH